MHLYLGHDLQRGQAGQPFTDVAGVYSEEGHFSCGQVGQFLPDMSELVNSEFAGVGVDTPTVALAISPFKPAIG